MGKPFSIRARLRSFRYAFKGLVTMVREEHNFRIHLVAVAVVTGLGFYLQVSLRDWLWLIMAMGLVISAEIFNSAIERLVDLKQPNEDPKAGKIKDLAAGAVLVTAVTAAIIGLFIFWPYIQ